MDTVNHKPVLVVGCGRMHRSDDAVGLLIADRLAALNLPATRVVASEAPGLNLPLWLEGTELLIVIDAAAPAKRAPPGTWTRIDYRRQRHQILGPRRRDTHGLGIQVALELSERLGLLPQDVWVYAIAAGDAGFGMGLSAAVAGQVDALTIRISAEIGQWLTRHAVSGAPA